MAELIYLFGAGVNQNISWREMQPPLASNFFQVASKSNKFTSEEYLRRINPLYKYISEHWGVDRDYLSNTPFNLEDLFTFLQIEMDEADREEAWDRYAHVAGIDFLLKYFLAEYLSEFDHVAITSALMRRFGDIIYSEKPTILTFNYDCIIETLLEAASGVNANIPQSLLSEPNSEEIPDDELPYSHHNWNRPLAYGISFSEVQLQRAGLSTYVEGKRFYGHPRNQLYSWRILKLHGSLNWFQYLPVRKYPALNTAEEKLPDEKLEGVLLFNGHWWFVEPPDFQGWLLDPLIITPVLYKDRFYKHKVFSEIWKQALNELSGCKRLVVIGYSFPQSDFHIKKLLLNAFRQEQLKDLVVVNPDTNTAKTAKELTRYRKEVLVCRDLEEYLGSHNK